MLLNVDTAVNDLKSNLKNRQMFQRAETQEPKAPLPELDLILCTARRPSPDDFRTERVSEQVINVLWY